MIFAGAEYAGKRKQPPGAFPDRDGSGRTLEGVIALFSSHYPKAKVVVRRIR
jgi:hypothetical protein